MTVAVIGGGINGIMSAWALAQNGHDVELFERDRVMGATSSASSKILHGGLRYLEQSEFRLVAESLRERMWWAKQVPEFARPVRFVCPVYADSPRPRWRLKAGLVIYDFLAGKSAFQKHSWHAREHTLLLAPGLRRDGLLGALAFSDALMDDYQLGLWAVKRAQVAGVKLRENMLVRRLDIEGAITTDAGCRTFDCVVNATGPWSEELLNSSGIKHSRRLDLVRGSHIVLDEVCDNAYLLQVPGERRICFVLPWKGKTLVGTTEVRQNLTEPMHCSEAELDYLLNVRNSYFVRPRTKADVVQTFSGLRPLIQSNPDATKATRDYALERVGKIVSIFGGKWTTARALGEKVATAVGSPAIVPTHSEKLKLAELDSAEKV